MKKSPALLLASLGLVATIVSSPARASAEPPPASPAPPSVSARALPSSPDPSLEPQGDVKPQTTWYGWQTLLVMGASAPLTPIAVGFIGFVLGGPVVHWAHGHAGKGFAALGLNLGLTAAGGGLGYLASGCAVHYGVRCGGEAGLVLGIGLGAGLGLLTANVIDIAALSYEPRRGDDKTAGRRHAPRVSVVPQVGLGPHQGNIGFVAAF